MRIGIVVYHGADELDVVAPHRVLAAAGFQVELVAERAEPIVLSHGLVIQPTATFDDASPLDGLLVAGGSSDSEQRGRRAEQRNERLLGFLRDGAARAELVGSVCTGAFLLADAGLLTGRRVNTHWRYRDELAALMRARREPVEVVGDRVVWDGALVTSGGVTSGIDLALEIVERELGVDRRFELEALLERETPPQAQESGDG